MHVRVKWYDKFTVRYCAFWYISYAPFRAVYLSLTKIRFQFTWIVWGHKTESVCRQPCISWRNDIMGLSWRHGAKYGPWCFWTHCPWCSRNPGVSGLSTSYTLLLWGWSDPSLCPDGYYPNGWLLASPLLPCLTCWGLWTEMEWQKPWHQTSIGKHLALQPTHGQSLTRPLYLASFLSEACSKLSSSRTTCLVDADSSTMSGLTVVVPEAKELHLPLEVYEYPPVSHRAPADVFTGGRGCSIALMNVMVALVGQDLLAQVLC